MAKSKNGGSRAYIRGRIGSDVYSVGKDGMGKKQQVVRSLAVQVTNPRSQSQMFGRMIMSTVMQGVSALSFIIDHSFDGVAKGQPSISEFIRRNYALVKADALAHPASGNSFGLNMYQEKGIKVGRYYIAAGSALLPSAVQAAMGDMYISLTAGTLTVGGLKAALGLSESGYLTFVRVRNTGVVEFVRAHLITTLSDETAITSDNVASLFSLESNFSATVSLKTNNIAIGDDSDPTNYAYGIIVSDYVDGAWIHNNCQLAKDGTCAYVSNTALPTYPVGSEQFLNGGDI